MAPQQADSPADSSTIAAPPRRSGRALLALLVALALTAAPPAAQAAPESLEAGAVFLPSEGVPPDLAADLTEVLAAGLESDGGAEVMAKERFQILLRDLGEGDAEACARDAGCIRRAGRRADLDFVVVAQATRVADGYQLSLSRYSVPVDIVRVLRFDLDEKLGQLAASLESARGELLRPDGALLIVDTNVSRASVFVDGVLLDETPLPPREIRAGEHRIVVRAVGYVPFEDVVRCEAGTPCRVTARLQLEPLPQPARRPPPEPEPAPTPIPPPQPPPDRPMSTQRILAWTSVGLAVAAGATGTGFAIGSGRAEDELNAKCDGGTRVCTISRGRAESLRDDGELYATLSNVFYGVAGAAAVTAIVLFVTEPDEAPAAVEVVPQASADGVGVGAVVRF